MEVSPHREGVCWSGGIAPHIESDCRWKNVSSVSIVTRLQTGLPKSLIGAKIFLCSAISTPATGFTQHHVWWVLGRVEPTTHLHPLVRLEMPGNYNSIPLPPLWLCFNTFTAQKVEYQYLAVHRVAWYLRVQLKSQ
jgi:hypothetical protein